MSDSERTLDAIGRAASELLPELTARLERHGLGEIEVAHGDLRLRVRAVTQGAPPAATESPSSVEADPIAAMGASGAGAAVTPPKSLGVTSPAVGFFVYGDGLGPGLDVVKGDALGHVEMLGVRHDVRAPRGGTVRNLVAESGEAVEYGQVVIEIDASGEAGR